MSNEDDFNAGSDLPETIPVDDVRRQQGLMSSSSNRRE